VLFLAGVVATLGARSATAAEDPPPVPRPDAIAQPVADGCQRNPVGLLTFTSPEWVYVYAYQSSLNPGVARVVEGDSRLSDVAGGDLPEGHEFYDFNTDVLPDLGYEYLMGGDPSVPNGNFADNPPILHVEWETGTLGQYAWITGGDRLKLWGQWVWDCGHWGQGFTADPDDPTGSIINDTDYFLPGTSQTGGLRGEQTEFHPMRAVIDTRGRPFLPVVGETQTDAFISSEGTLAAASSRCAQANPAPSPTFYGPSWTACINLPESRRNRVNDRDYTFFIPAPPRPGNGSGRLRFRVENHDPAGTAPDEIIVPRRRGIQVTVPFKGFGSDTETLAYGKSLFVGWNGARQDIPAKVQVTFQRIKINNSLDDPGFSTSAGVPPGEWELYSDLNGSWAHINQYAPDLDLVNTGDVVNLDHTYEINVPAGDGLRIGIDGRECDLPRIQPCPTTSEVAEDNDSPGEAADSFGSVDEAIGTHILKGGPASSPNYELTYDVKLLSSAGSRRIHRDPGCGFDVFSPHSWMVRSGVRALGSRITVQGGSRDRNCRTRSGKPRRVEVSIARKVGKRCRFLERGGRLSAPRRCRQRSYLGTKGRRRWRAAKRWPRRPGTYVIASRATDRTGNIEITKSKGNLFRLVVP
jgi:hypothetical protein